MSPNQFNSLMHYLRDNHTEIYVRYPNNFILSEQGDLQVFRPAKVSDEEHKKLMGIIQEWEEKNGIV